MRVEVLEGAVEPRPGEVRVVARASSPGQRPARVHVAGALLTADVPLWGEGGAAAVEALESLVEEVAAAAHGQGAASILLPALGVEPGGAPAHPVAHATMRALRRAHGGGHAPPCVRIHCRDPVVAAIFRDALAANAIVRRPWS